MEKTEPDIVKAAISGNRDAFSELVKRYSGPMSALAYDRLGNVADAQDAVQEAFLVAFKKRASLREAEKFGSWLYEILRNACAQRMRAWGIDSRAVDVLKDKQAGEQPLTPLDHAVATERSHQLRKAVERLSPPLREIVVLRYLGGAGRQEAAAMLDISLAAADKRLERALSELRESLK
ncbi:MAG: sigma-70 family RNA polymerase sigma factor [Planctomycetes bacterium]|nr:sigma-70 family RNA polymerase sigma factor [Planctomycetota bacterium]